MRAFRCVQFVRLLPVLILSLCLIFNYKFLSANEQETDTLSQPDERKCSRGELSNEKTLENPSIADSFKDRATGDCE